MLGLVWLGTVWFSYISFLHKSLARAVSIMAAIPISCAMLKGLKWFTLLICLCIYDYLVSMNTLLIGI